MPLKLTNLAHIDRTGHDLARIERRTIGHTTKLGVRHLVAQLQRSVVDAMDRFGVVRLESFAIAQPAVFDGLYTSYNEIRWAIINLPSRPFFF